MKNWALAFLLLAGLLGPLVQRAQTFDAGIDFVSRYVWRGFEISKSPAVQPWMELKLANLSFMTWGSYSFAHESLQEVDLQLAYQVGPVSLQVNDYFMVSEDDSSLTNYLWFQPATTGHALELAVLYTGPEGFPIDASINTYVLGADHDVENHPYYSTYFEVGYTYRSLRLYAGLSPWKGIYSQGPAFTNVGLEYEKEWKITEHFALPLAVRSVVNPDQRQIWIVGVVSL